MRPSSKAIASRSGPACSATGLRGEALARLAGGLGEVLEYAAGLRVAVGFEPEPGMLIDSMTAFEELLRAIDASNLKLSLDVGHLHCQGEEPIAERIRTWASWLVNVHVEDMCAGVHEHLMFGEGDIDFPPVLRTLAEVGYGGGLHVEMSRHSHESADSGSQSVPIPCSLS